MAGVPVHAWRPASRRRSSRGATRRRPSSVPQPSSRQRSWRRLWEDAMRSAWHSSCAWCSRASSMPTFWTPRDMAFREFDELLHHPAAVRRQAVPDDQQRAVNVTDQSLQKVDDFELADRAGIEPKVKIAQRQPGRNRKLFPVEVELQQRRLPARRPGAAAMRLLAQSAFVDEDDRAALFAGFFLMAGHLWRFHSRMPCSLRSRAWPTGRCGLQPSARGIFHTWPS